MSMEHGGIQFGCLIFHFAALINLWEVGRITAPVTGMFAMSMVLFAIELFVLIPWPSRLSILLHLAGGLAMFLFATSTAQVDQACLLISIIVFNGFPGILTFSHAVLLFKRFCV